MQSLGKRRTMVLASAALALGLVIAPFGPAHAAGAAACQLAGLVHLSQQTPLTNADKGTGSFNSSAAFLSCTGSVVGTGAVGGSFSFCRHNYTGSADGNPACHGPTNNGPDSTLDPAYDAVNGTTGQGLVSHFTSMNAAGNDRVSAGNFAVGGTCSFSFEGHAATAQAEITVRNFTCSGLPGVVMQGRATASSGFVILPCSAGLCFQDVVFLGTIEVAQV